MWLRLCCRQFPWELGFGPLRVLRVGLDDEVLA